MLKTASVSKRNYKSFCLRTYIIWLSSSETYAAHLFLSGQLFIMIDSNKFFIINVGNVKPAAHSLGNEWEGTVYG
jgi:hypothetical protein